MRVLVTGGAGFVGSSLALSLKSNHPEWSITSLDNLKRRGSELSLPRLRAGGVEFVHGDVRVIDDLIATGPCDVILECSAEPSVLAGLNGSPAYVLQTNLLGTLNCLEHARKHKAGMLFLSTSRVYPMGPLGSLPLFETETRFEWDPVLNELDLYPGITTWGVSERFPLTGARSIYGATKLASELFIQEYTAAYGMPTLIDRCGVLAGPWQMGKVDQGVVMHWVASHFFARPLRYIGYGGSGKQVRDVLHIDDLVDLVELQLARFPSWHAEVFNVGGGRASSVSLLELTTLCRHETGVELDIPGVAETRQADIPLYLTDNSLVTETFDWSPRRKPETIVHDIYRWMVENRNQVQEALGI